MIVKRLLVSLLFVLLSSNLNWNSKDAFGKPKESSSARDVAQSTAPLTWTLGGGALQLKNPLGTVISGMKIRLNYGEGLSLLYDFELGGQDKGRDEAGGFERTRYNLKLNPSSPAPPHEPIKAVLEIREYLQPKVVVAFLDYGGPPPAPRGGIQLLMALDNFARGMATKRLKLYWTSPAFVSDYRMLSASNQLLLWRQIAGDDYHLLVPLAGDGMVGELGVSEINYRYEFRIASSSYDPKFSPRRVPLFAYASSRDPYQLPRDAYATAFAASEQWGRLRWQKSYPEVFKWLGWCSWNAYEHSVSEEKVLASVRSLLDKRIPLGFVLVDDGWLSVKNDKLTAFNADAQKFPNDLSGLAKALREQYRIPHVGVWHTFQGYWSGVETDSEIGRAHQLFQGLGGRALPDPRGGRGESFYRDWYSRLKSWGFDFVKVDGQGNNIKFTDGLMPLFSSGGGTHRNLQEAAQKFFSDPKNGERAAGLNLINCMEMSLENAFNWRISNIARNSDDYLPDNPQNVKEHTYYNAYNAYWTSNFAYPDWDMFQSHDAHGLYHAVARAISGGPVYFTDKPGLERPEILLPLALSDGRVLMLDEPGQVTRDLLLTDVALEAVPLKVFGRITRPGLSAGMLAVFNVNKSAARVSGVVRAEDVEMDLVGADRSVAAYQRGKGSAFLLDARSSMTITLDGFGFDLFTFAPVNQGVAVFGLLNKYLGPAAVVSQKMEAGRVTVRVSEAGEFGAWLSRQPGRVEIDGRALDGAGYSYKQGLLRIPQSSFGERKGEREVRITLARMGR
jgi:raffinose synthase